MDEPISPPKGARLELALCVVTLALMALIPLLEAVLRPLFGKGIPGAILIVQHLTLCVAMAGAALAADARSLIALSTATFLRPSLQQMAGMIAGGLGAAVTAWLCAASVALLRVDHATAGELALGVPVWAVVAWMPVFYGVIALRLVHRAAATLRGRAVALAIAGAGALVPLVGQQDGVIPSPLAWIIVVVLLAAATIGLPMFALLGGIAMVMFAHDGTPIASVPVETFSLATSSLFPAIPLFTLAGYILSAGSASARLVRFFIAWFGWVRGGPALVTALVFAFFTAITGASGVTILSLGGLLLPVLRKTGHTERFSIGLLTTSGSIGALFPPSLPVILYAVSARLPIEQLFAGGLVPGIILVGSVAAFGIVRAPAVADARGSFQWSEARASLWAARWELLLPVLILAGIFGGVATLVEAAAATVLYAFIVESVVHREPNFSTRMGVALRDCSVLVGSVLIVLGVALGLTNYVMDAQVPMLAADWARAHLHSPWTFLIALNVLLLVVGAAMDIYSAILVVVPLILPMGEAFGVDPVHLGVVFLTNLQLGYLVPPVGENLFLASSRFDKPLLEVFRATVPFVIIIAAVALLVTFVPALTTVPQHWILGH